MAHFLARAANEHRVGIWQLRPGFRRFAQHGDEILDVHPFCIATDQFIVVRIHFNRIGLAATGDLRGFDRDRSAAGADIPHDAARAQVELGQRRRANFGRCEQTLLGLGLQKTIVMVAE